MRKLPSIVAAVGLVLVTSACSAGPGEAHSCSPAFSDGANAKTVTATGGFGSDPKASFPTPLISTGEPDVATVSEGDGRRVSSEGTAVIQVTIYDGKTGASIINTQYDTLGILLNTADTKPAFGAVTQCAEAGSRIAAVGTAGALLGKTAMEQNQLAISTKDTIVLVVDVQSAYLGRADGANQLPPAGLPSVVLAPDGRPGITLSKAAAPTDLRIANLKKGNGAKVEKGDRVILNYTGVLWGTDTVFDSTWDRGNPAALTAESVESSPEGVVPGFAEALIGQRVGSQVIAVIPPKFGYKSGSSPAAVPEGSTMVFVFDVLGIEG